jgi:Family of unknown function (DUF6541)
VNLSGKWVAPAAGTALVVMGAMGAWLSHAYVVQVLGTAAWLAGLTLLWRAAWPWLDQPLPRLRWRKGSPDDQEATPVGWTWQRLVRESAAPLLLLVALVVLYHPLLAGHMPWQADHTVHQWKAWLLSEKLLPSGRLMGWTHQSGTGYPAEVLYPPLGDLWMATVRYVTFGALSWEATYALGFFGVLAFCTGAFYHLGRRLFGPVAGLAAAFFVLTDMGGFREGGYIFTVRYGVWPLQLGITLGFVALLKFHDLLRTPGWRHLLRCGLAVGAALLAHPVTLIFFLVALPLYALLRWLRSSPDTEPMLGKGLAGVGIGLGMVAFWLLPFFGKASGFSAHVTNHWKSMADIADGVIAANLWRNAWSWPLILGCLGGGVALRERRPMASYLFALSALFLVAGSLTTFNELGVANWIASARFVQFQRFVIFVKLAWFLLAGYLLQRVLSGISPTADDARDSDVTSEVPAAHDDDPKRSRWRRAGGVAAVCLLAAPFVLPVTWKLTETRLLPVGQLTSVREKGPFLRNFRALLAQVCRARKQKDAGFFRLGYLSGFNDHEMANGATYCDVPEVKLSFIPSETFKYRANLSPAAVPRSKEDFRALNVRFLMVNGTRPAPSWARLVVRRGRLALYEVDDYRPERYTVLRRTVPDGGAARYERVDPATLGLKTRFSDEEITISAKDVPPDHFLVLHVAHFANWTARRGTTDLSIRAYDELAPKVKGLMMVPLQSGVTVFAYKSLWVDHLSRAVTLLTVLLVIFIVVARRKARLAEPVVRRLAPWVKRLRRPARWAALGAVVLAALVLLAKGVGVVPRQPGPRSLTHEISDAQVSVRHKNGRVKRCTVFQMGRWICGQGRRWVGPVAEEWNLLNRFGLWAHPPAHGSLVISFPRQKLGSGLEIHYGVLQSGGVGESVTLDVFIDDKRVGQVRWPRTRGRPGWAGRPHVIDTRAKKGRRATVRFEVSTPHIGGRHFAFDARILP